MSAIYLLAAQTLSLVFMGRGIDLTALITTFTDATNVDGFCFPGFVVPVSGSYEGVGDFVENCVSNFGWRV
jgi:hypothetical protein